MRGSSALRAGVSSRSGSSQIACASLKSMPCFTLFAADFRGSNSNRMRYRNYTTIAHRRQRAPKRGVSSIGGEEGIDTILRIRHRGGLVRIERPQEDRSGQHGVQHVFDLHWKIANPQLFADLLSYDDLHTEAVAVPALGEHARAVDGIPALVLACVHRMAHHNDSIDLLWLYDIHLLATGMDERQARAPVV